MKKTFRLTEGRASPPRDVHDEITFHLAERTREFMEQGLAPEAARQAAIASFGDVAAIEAELHVARRERDGAHRRREWGHLAWDSLRHAVRSLRRSPAFTVTAALTLALGAGALTATFSVVDAVLLRPLPYRDPAHIVSLGHTAPGVNMGEVGQSTGSYLTYRRLTQSFEEIGMYTVTAVAMSDPTGAYPPDRLRVGEVTPSVFRVLGVPASHGRVFTDAEGAAGATPAVILSHHYWRNRFGADPAVVGRLLTLAGVQVEVVGIMPAGFTFPDGRVQAWIPMQVAVAPEFAGGFEPAGIARLRRGVGAEAATADLQRALARVPDLFPNLAPGVPTAAALTAGKMQPSFMTLRARFVGDFAETLGIVGLASVLVLLVACTNVANLFLVRGEAQQKELTVRAALGARRSHVVLHFVAEATVLGVLGAAVGFGLAHAGVRLLQRVGPTELPRLDEVSVNGAALTVAVAAALAGALLSVVLPIMRQQRVHVGSTLRESGRGGSASRAQQRTRAILVVAQVAMALMLLGGSGLLARSVSKLRAVTPGFDAAGVLSFRLELPSATYPRGRNAAAFHQQLLDALRALPGVSDVGLSTRLPLTLEGANLNPVAHEDAEVRPGALDNLVTYVRATPTFFSTLRIPLVAGRAFEGMADAQSPFEIVVSRKVARDLWGDSTGHGVIGRRIRTAPGTLYTVVGVVEATRDSALSAEPMSLVYFPIATRADSGADRDIYGMRSVGVAVRASVEPRTLIPAIRSAVAALDPALPIYNVLRMEEVVAQSMARTSFLLAILAAAAAVTLVLGAVGLYGVIAYVVTLRTRELGVRLALGAPPSRVRRLVARQGLQLALAGCLLGLVGIAGGARLLRGFLFGVGPLDPVTLAGVTGVLVAIAGIASWVPARRAARINPVDAMARD